MKNEKNKNTMEFVMPSKYDINSISNPNDKDVTIFESEAKYYACIRYGGYSNDSKFKEHSKDLSQKLKELNIETCSFCLEQISMNWSNTKVQISFLMNPKSFFYLMNLLVIFLQQYQNQRQHQNLQFF